MPGATTESLQRIFPDSGTEREARIFSVGAIQAGSKALQLLALPGFSAKVLAVLSGGVYLSAANGEIFWICSEGAPLHRRGIFVSRLPLVTPGEPCSAASPGLAFSGGASVALRGAGEWVPPEPEPETSASPAIMRTRLRRLLAVLELFEIPDGLGPSLSLLSALAKGRAVPSFPPGSLMERVKAAIWGLARDCRRGEIAPVALKGRELTGLGPGLTPSGDDFLGGLFFAVQFLRRICPAAFPHTEVDLSGLLDWARTRTHPVSHAVFGDLVMGHGPGPLHELAGQLAGRPEDPVQALDAAVRLSRIGHSSGWDMLAGFLTGMLMIDHKE